MKALRTCPRCKRKVSEGVASAPFCSRRCQMADLGAWLGEEYRVPVAEPEDPEEPRPAETDPEDA